ncbi:hypothetical protein [Comamonas kerstersii]|uniref:hypothetical protein n=1 Tax=Comamonas kerstersii TaxID=225992 RepID=UPI00147830A2|nr:hypothetical protein [Comamonas kerstersii]MDO4968751.1 hypothetical protein [Comamonadaceae bacterium]
MLIRWTVLCAAVAALTACSAVSPAKPAANADAKAQTITSWSYPSEHNQFRELGWE